MMRINAYDTPTINIDHSLPYKRHRTDMTNHMGSIARHITPLVINSLGARHTHKHTHMHTEETRCVPGLKTGPICLALVGLMAGWLAGWLIDEMQVEDEIFKIPCSLNYSHFYSRTSFIRLSFIHTLDYPE